MVVSKIVFIGRLEKDTGVLNFLNWLDKNPGYSVDFIGDGSLRSKCGTYGTVRGFSDPKPFLKNAKYAVPGGYLSYIEAVKHGCKILTFPNNPLKKDYWNEIKKIKKFPTWDKIADVYINLWKS